VDTISLAGQRPSHPPLTPAQHALWYLDRLHPNSALYNVPFATRITGTLDLTALNDALGAVVARAADVRGAGDVGVRGLLVDLQQLSGRVEDRPSRPLRIFP